MEGGIIKLLYALVLVTLARGGNNDIPPLVGRGTHRPDAFTDAAVSAVDPHALRASARSQFGDYLSCADVRGWVAADFSTCDDFASASWCTADGRVGSGWNVARGEIDDFALLGVSAFEACCACGGGRLQKVGGNEQRTRRQAESVEIVGTAGVLTPNDGSFSIDVTYSTAMAPGTVNLRCNMR